MTPDRPAAARRGRLGSARRCLAALLCLIALAAASVASPAAAQDAVGPAAGPMAQPDWRAWDKAAADARKEIEARTVDAEQMAALRAAFDKQSDRAKEVSEQAAAEIARLEKELAALGPAPEEGADEAPEARSLRERLDRALSAARAVQGQAERARIRARELVADLVAFEQRRFLAKLEETGPSPANPANWLAAAAHVGDVVGRIGADAVDQSSASGFREMAVSQGPLIGLAVVTALFIAFGVRGATLGLLLRRATDGAPRRNRLLIGIGATVARIVILLIAEVILLVALVSVGFGGPVGDVMLHAVGIAMTCMIGAYALAAALFSPSAAGLRLSRLSDWSARLGFIMTLILGAALAFDFAVRIADEVAKPSPQASAVLTFIAVAVGAFALWRLAQIAKPLIAQEIVEGETLLSIQIIVVLRRAALVVAAVAPALALVGYEFAARALFFPAVLSLAIIAVAYLIFAVIGEAVEIYLADADAGGDGERLRLIPIFVGFLLFCVTVPVLAIVWGADWVDIADAYQALAAGFTLGDVSLSPIDFVTFAIVFGLIFTITRMAQRVLKGAVLPKTRINSGAADAMIAGLGYVGVMVAALAAIAATGIDLSNLAIVAGALSVGIGFGLQNIVNNFVSGLILLVERPIKVGDWIEVGGAQGYVKKVNVRSTEIETFDRSSYILPNSDLISGAVLNWTHSDTMGRVVVPVGVAYETEPREVEAILLEVAKAHPMVVASPPPVAYFMRFGADALEFELRAFLRDVNWMLAVTSDLNFRIAERFREEGIEFPFSQRDLHIRTLGPLEGLMRDMREAPADGGAKRRTGDDGAAGESDPA